MVTKVVSRQVKMPKSCSSRGHIQGRTMIWSRIASHEVQSVKMWHGESLAKADKLCGGVSVGVC